MDKRRDYVHAAITALIQKIPSKAVSTHEKCKILVMSIDSNQDKFQKFSATLMGTFEAHIKKVTQRLRATASKRQRMWSSFHTLRFSEDLNSMWTEFISSLGVGLDGSIDGSDQFLKQLLFEEVYEKCMYQFLSEGCSKTTSTPSENGRPLTADEVNVVRYVGGYVARSLLKKYEKIKSDIASQFVICLGEMAVEGEGGDVLAYTRKWIEKVNRGGLYPINDEAFTLFVCIEKCVRDLLPGHLIKSDSDRDSFHKNVHLRVLQDDDVMFHWTLLSQDITSPEDSELLLKDIIKLWITIRGYSIAAAWMEVYKGNEKKNTQKSTGLRKSISGGSS